MHPSQCRAARVALGLSQGELATASGVNWQTIRRLEGGADARAFTLDRLRAAFVEKGIRFEVRDGHYWIGFPADKVASFHGRSKRTRDKGPSRIGQAKKVPVHQVRRIEP